MSNRTFDSEFCGSLPLNNINQVQAYGYLLVLDKNTLEIIQASENVSAITGKRVQEVVGTNLREYVNDETAGNILEKFSSAIRDKVPVTFQFASDEHSLEYVAIVHSKETYLILELELGRDKNTFIEVFQKLKFIMAELNLADSVKTVSEIAVRSLKELGGFDRVLMYQFDEDWNGTVIAEERDEKLQPYIGLKFPASDIPRQARALYLRNAYRLIPDRDYTPVRLFPVINPATHSFIDLSDCNLRAVAGVHLEYMQNMGISASMSVRVIYNEQLWGLISCHNRLANYLSFEMCSIFELLSEVISSKISALLSKENFQFKTSLINKRNILTDRIYKQKNVQQAMFDDLTLLELFNCNGAAIAMGGTIETIGDTPSESDIKNLLLWLQYKYLEKVFCSSNVEAVFEQGSEFTDKGSGVLAIPIDSDKMEYLVLFRPEVVKTVSWGGNPEEAINFEEDGKKYHPRLSFKLWQETVKHTSSPWKQEELEIAENLRSFIFEYTARNSGNN